MAWFYVKNGGTATGDAGRYGTEQTGTFAALGAAGYYNDIEAALAATTAPTTGDFVLVSDLHSHTYGAAVTITGITPSNFTIACVDDANIDAYRTTGNRGLEQTPGTAADYTLSDVSVWGMEFSTGDDVVSVGNCFYRDCKFTIPGNGDKFSLFGGDRQSAWLDDCEVALNDAGASFLVLNGNVVHMNGGSVTTTSGGVTALIDSDSSFNGGLHMFFSGVDLTAVTGTLFSGVGLNATDDTINVRFDRCRLASGVAFTDEQFRFFGQRAEFTRCSDDNNASEYQYHLTAFGGQVDDDSVIYRNEDSAFTDSNVKISYKAVTNSDCSVQEPLWFDFPITRRSDLASASSDVLRFYIASTDALTDVDVYVVVQYPDGTTRAQVNQLSSAPSSSFTTALNPLSTPTALTADVSSDWRNGGGAFVGNEYLIDIDTSLDAGASCVPSVRIFITKPSSTIQIASEFDLL